MCEQPCPCLSRQPRSTPTALSAAFCFEPLRPPPALPAADGAVRVYDAYSGALSKLLRLHHGAVTALQQAQHGASDLLVSGGDDGRVLLTDAGTGLTLAEAQLPQGGACICLAFQNQGERGTVVWCGGL